MPSLATLLPVAAFVCAAVTAVAADLQNTSLRGRRTETMEYQAVMAVADPQCFIENGWDYVGNDMGNEPGNVESCCGKCQNRQGCEAWSWSSHNGGTCWLKSGADKIVASPGVKSALFFFGTRPRCQLIQDYDFEGNDVGDVKSNNADACCGICQGFAGCRSYTWSNYAGGTCWLKSEWDGKIVYKQGVKSGVAYPVEDSQCRTADADTDYVNNDIGSQQGVANPGRCCDLCRAVDNCRAYSWTAQNRGTCYFKSKMGDKIFQQGVVSAQVYENPDAICRYQDNVDYVGQDIGNKPGNKDACCSICRSMAGCKAYTWSNHNGGTCWLKNGNLFVVGKAGVNSGYIF